MKTKKDKSSKKKVKKDRLEGATRAFQVVSGIFFTLFLVTLIICLCTSKKGIEKLCKDYVYSVEITNEYFDNYIDAGFTEEMCYELLKSIEVKDSVAYVMYDRVLAIFHNTSSYEYTIEYCKEQIGKKITEISNNNNLSLSETQISNLTSYTVDICGISSMFIYDSPTMYRTSVFEATDEDIGSYGEIFEMMATLTSPFFPICFGVMFLICIIILVVICEKPSMNRLFLLICDTMLYPSLVCLAFSIAELFGKKNGALVIQYIFKNALTVSIIGVLLGITGAIITRKIINKNNVVYEE